MRRQRDKSPRVRTNSRNQDKVEQPKERRAKNCHEYAKPRYERKYRDIRNHRRTCSMTSARQKKRQSAQVEAKHESNNRSKGRREILPFPLAHSLLTVRALRQLFSKPWLAFQVRVLASDISVKTPDLIHVFSDIPARDHKHTQTA